MPGLQNPSSAELQERERALISRILAGETDLFHELIRPYEHMVYSTVLAMVKNEAEAEDGAQALEMCRRDLPDAVLLDLNMPKMDGMTFLKEMRNLPGGLRPKVVFCTIENDAAQITRVLRAGADEYIMKPFDKEIVEAKFQQVGFG